ncbi:penicillin-binding protein 2 [Galbibacter pacificus]|uniref:Penicillin-binding protein 2 n=1 Tax=Galbibacter pacificus TaxID=2996052 RepID=A0ABT6FW53_9FLAO|nr:penicillin-binding protein 2 [Galbibacter pacificus]MDG3584075.1 penicillin-binding protein 2 [Galbibacter pacificus]MDG3587492.1 penicillin-binding protein 2 [Galbibacter pacificus]
MRKLLLSSIIVIVAIVYIGRLSYLQLLDNTNKNPLDDTAIKAVYDYPERGYIYDRNGELLVANQPSYDVMVIPRDVKPLDTVEFCTLLNISKEDFSRKFEKAYTYSPRLPSVFVPQLSKKEYAILQEKMRKYEGFYIQKRSLRHYMTSVGANILGYISEVNDWDLKEYSYYQSGELIGRQGVEKQYEEVLRGRKGVKFIQKDRFNRVIGPYKEGIYDTLPVPGKDIELTIDNKLQAYGEKLMIHKRGGIVALDPKTGQILALITAPNYDPDLLVGRKRSKNYTELYYDSIAKPLYDRALNATYPPGSPFKTVNALIGLQEGVIDEQTTFTCYHGYRYGRNSFMGCHCPYGSVNNLDRGIYMSCNAYFANTYRRIIEKYPSAAEGMDAWQKHVESFGLGNYLGYDLPTGQSGKVPDEDYYNLVYGPKRWFATNTLSNAIGQGEVLTTPIQLANLTATIANRGYYFTPHIIKKIENDTIAHKFVEKHQTTVDPQYFEPVVEGMRDVYEKGTAQWIKIPDISMAGKTGTAENFTKINDKRVQLTDHSIFVAFAPVEDPKIAIAVFVENGYWGSRWAGRIAGLMIEKYIKGEITRTDMEEYVLNGSLEEEYAKPLSGKSFTINDGKFIKWPVKDTVNIKVPNNDKPIP